MDRPPPYFPQNSLQPRDEKRYLKFKLVVGGAIIVGLGLLAGISYGMYLLISWLVL